MNRFCMSKPRDNVRCQELPEIELRGNVGFSIAQYASLRPTLWHLTHSENLELIKKAGVLMPTILLSSASLNGPRRKREINPGIPVLRDQDLLHEKCIEFESGYSMTDFLRDLRERVFFWSGWSNRPVEPGRDAVSRYRNSDVLIRLPFLEVAKDNTPYFSRCNSGAPRMQHGKPVPRGRKTFVTANDCEFAPSSVVEVTFVKPVPLPPSTEVSCCLEGPWQFLLSNPEGQCKLK